MGPAVFLAREERPGATEALLMKTLPQDRPEAGFSWSARLAICSFDVAKWEPDVGASGVR